VLTHDRVSVGVALMDRQTDINRIR